MELEEAEMFYKQAMSFLEQGNLKKSLEFFNKTLDADNSYIPAWNNKGVVLMDMERFSSALECFEKVIQLEDINLMAWYNKGYVLQILGEYEKSAAALETFLTHYQQKDEFYKYALYLQAHAYYHLTKNNQAFNIINKALDMDKTFPEALELKEKLKKRMKK